MGFLARARLNALKLEDQIGRGVRGYDKTCKLCNLAKEDMVHFIIDCPALEGERNYDLIKKLGNNSRDQMVDLLFGNDRFQEVGCMVRKLWQRRRKILAYIQKENATRSQPKKGNRDNSYSPMVHMMSDLGPVREGPAVPRGRSL